MSATVMSAAEVIAAAADEPELGTRVYRVPPGELVVGHNVRTEVRVDPGVAASIRRIGVLQPIICYIVVGALQVHMGQARAVIAAREGRPWVPVLLAEQPDEEDRLIEQLAENEHRTALSTTDRAGAVAQLALLGLTAEQLTRKTSLRRRDVDDALAVANSPAAAAAAAACPQLDLAQAAAVAEFAEEPDVVEALTEAAGEGGFDHVLQSARDDRRDRTEHAAVLGNIRAAGVQALASRPPHSGPARELDQLGISPDRHADCPGHAAYPVHGSAWVDGRWEQQWHPRYLCLDPITHGHTTPAAPSTSTPTLADEEARARRARTVEETRAWRSASKVRRKWLRQFARGRTVPPGAELFIALCLIESDGTVLGRALVDQHRLLRDLLYRAGEDPAPAGTVEPATTRATEVDTLLADVAGAGPRRSLRLTCALLLAAWEAAAHPDGARRDTRPADEQLYFRQMVLWGYEPAPVEQHTLDAAEPTR